MALEFQITSWDHYDDVKYIEKETANCDSDDNYTELKKFKVRLYGTARDGKKVFVEVNDFTPHFYVQIPRSWREHYVRRFIKTVKGKVRPELRNSLKSYQILSRHIFEEFTNYQKFNFVRLVFHSQEGFEEFRNKLRYRFYDSMLSRRGTNYRTMESVIEPFFRLIHIQSINPCGWVKISDYEDIGKSKPTNGEINIRTHWKKIKPIEDNSIAKLIVAAFDIECTSGDGSFPQPHRSKDQIIQIGTTFNYYGNSECFYKHIAVLGSCDPIPGVDVECYNSERDLLIGWQKMIKEKNPDIMTGYNTFGFDFRYIHARAEKLGCNHTVSQIGRLNNQCCEFIEKELSSSALGDNKLHYYNTFGRVQIDLLKVIQRDHKLPSYTLDSVAAEFIKETVQNFENDGEFIINTKSTYGLQVGRYIKIYSFDGLTDNVYEMKLPNSKKKSKFQVVGLTPNTIRIKEVINEENLTDQHTIYWCQAKDDVSAQDIFRLQKGSATDRATIAKYCIQDCVLCNKLMEKLHILTNNIAMANVCYVPLSYIFLRGQGVKILSLVSKKCRELNHLIPDKPPQKREKPEDKKKKKKNYEGANVLDPVGGLYYVPIPVLDYASLYPRSMIHRNISHECYVKNSQYDNLPGYTYYDITYYQPTRYVNKRGKEYYEYDRPKPCRFAKRRDGKMGILPQILKEKLDQRDGVKALMCKEKDPFKKKILDGQQLALKVTANSIYGQTGATTSAIGLEPIAACTTTTGRELLHASRVFAENVLPKIINPILDKNYDEYVKNINLMFNKDIDEMLGPQIVFKLKKRYDSLKRTNDHFFLRVFQEKLKPLTDDDFINSKKEHNCKQDFIDYVYKHVTELLEDHTINPICVYGDSVTQDTPLLLKNGDDIEIKTIGNLNDELKWKAYNEFKIEDIDTNRKEKQQNTDPVKYKVWTDNGWAKIRKVIRHKCKKKIYRIVTPTSTVDVTEDHSLLDKNKNIVKPTDCGIGTELLHNPFFDNIMPCISKKGSKIITKKICGKLNTMKEFYKLRSQGYDVYIKVDDSNVFTLKYGHTSTSTSTSTSTHNITQIIDMGYTNEEEDYVYDLETATGNFNAGIGEIIVKNTDSVFINFDIRKDNEKLTNKEVLVQNIKLGVLCGDLINFILPWPHNLEYEKTFHPWIILTKKRYVGNLYEFNPDKFYQKSMGIVLKRRDNAPIVKIVVGGIVKSILVDRNSQKAIAFTRRILKKILSGKFPIEKFIITKTLRAEYKDRTRIVHAVLADRIAERDPGNKPQTNNRIPYVFIEVDESKVELQGDRVEHPDYVKKHELRLDYLYYITNQIMKPAIQFLEKIVKNPQKVFQNYIIREENRRNGCRPITYYFKENSEQENLISFSLDGKLSDSDSDSDTNHNHYRHKKNKHVRADKKTVQKKVKRKPKKKYKVDTFDFDDEHCFKPIP